MGRTVAEMMSGNISNAITNVKTWGGLIINVKDYGANGKSDDTKAIIAAINTAKPNDIVVVNVEAIISDTIFIEKEISFICLKDIVYKGPKDRPALVIAEQSALSLQKYIIRIKSSEINWDNEDYTGVKIGALKNSEINIANIYGFTNGVITIPDNDGCAYNEFTINYIRDCKRSLVLSNKNGGWSNENLFLGPFRLLVSSESPADERFGIVITSEDGGYVNNNSNTFLKPCFELGSIPIGDSCCVHIIHGSRNSFERCRYENQQRFAEINNGATFNDFSFSFTSKKPEILERNVTSIVLLNLNRDYGHFKPVFNYYLDRNLAEYNDSGSFSVRGASVFDVGSTWFDETNRTRNTTFEDGYLVCTGRYFVGIFVDARQVKMFWPHAAVADGYGGRVWVKCFDEEMNPINGDPSVLISGIGYDYSSTGNGIFIGPGLDSGDGVYRPFRVTDEVKYIAIVFASGTNPIKLKGISLEVFAEYVKPVVFLKDYGHNLFSANKIPTRTDLQGNFDIVYNENPASGNAVGWININGTFQQIGTYP